MNNFTIGLWSIIYLFAAIITPCNGISFEESVLSKQQYSSLDDWSNQLNSQLYTINQYTAYFAWELSIRATEELSRKSVEFNALKSRWVNIRCAEIDDFAADNLNETHKMAIGLLCNGPKFSQNQSNRLTNVLYQMQQIFTETQICLPRHFDICLNLDRIWEFTYLKKTNGDIEPLDMSFVAMQFPFKTNLMYFNGNISEEYYALGSEVNEIYNGDVEELIRNGQFLCFDGEVDFDRIMRGEFEPFHRQDCGLRFNEIFRWAWESWRLTVGTAIGELYPKAVEIMNDGAQNNGYLDIGEVWREELHMPNLRATVDKLMKDVKPFYELLHGALRNVLWERISPFEPFVKNKTIPAHMLGSMWAQDWQLYHDLLVPFFEVNLDENIKRTNWTSIDMVKRADDFYSSMGMPGMTKEFWEQSFFEKGGSLKKCHGTAANMFKPNDFRMIVCAERSFEDFYVIVHEMGHIQYYMAYENQPTIFQDANSALQESIGDAVFLAVMTPQHLNRLRLLPDKYLFAQKLSKFDQTYLNMVHEQKPNKEFKQFSTVVKNKSADESNVGNIKELLKTKELLSMGLPPVTVLGKPLPNITDQSNRMKNYLTYKARIDSSINSFDISLLLRMALTKIPQIPFEYIVDVFRWDLFSGEIPFENANEYWWHLAMKEQGIHPPDWKNRREFFDAGAKYHVADNTPFVRYFLASFLQTQIFQGLCEVTVFGQVKPGKPLPMPLHRCDIYGSKRAGKLLQKALKIGASQPWQEVLYILTGDREVKVDSLLLYYDPLINWLEKLAIEFDIPIGW